MDKMKISFNFSKVTKKPNVFNAKAADEPKKVELIKCFDGSAIQLVEETPKEELLVIPVKNEQSRSAVYLKNKYSAKSKTDEPAEKPPIDPNETLDQRAARELLESVQNRDDDDEDQKGGNLVLPLETADQLPLDGAKEPTIDDYDSIPITQFGMAMLRGMGWKDDTASKKKKELNSDEPILRPKGMGLGADKAVKPKVLLVAPEPNERLELKKTAYVKILGGKHKDMYGQVEGLDEYAGRVIVKLALGGTRETFNEFLVQPVSKKEYGQYGKVINSTKYEEYKKREESKSLGEKYVSSDSIKTEKKEEINEDKKYIKKEKHDDRYDKYVDKKSIKEEHYDYDRRRRSSSKKRDDRYDKYEEKKPTKEENEDYGRRRNRSSSKKRDDKYEDKKPIKEDYEEYGRRRHRSSSVTEDCRDKSRSKYDSREERSRRHISPSTEKHKKSSKKDSHRDRSRRYSSSEDEKRHKKKSKKNKKGRSRSRSKSRDRRHR